MVGSVAQAAQWCSFHRGRPVKPRIRAFGALALVILAVALCVRRAPPSVPIESAPSRGDVTHDSGLSFVVRDESHAPPSRVRAVVLDSRSNPLAGGEFAPAKDGTVVLDSVPAGTWTLLVGAEGLASTSAQVDHPGRTAVITLRRSCVVEVEVPSLFNYTAPAHVLIQTADGWYRELRSWRRPQEYWPLVRGRALVPSVPCGELRVVVGTDESKLEFETKVVARPGTPAKAVVRIK